MEWVNGKDLLIMDEKVSCCDKGNKVIMICTSYECRQKQRLICMKCSIVHQHHMNDLIQVSSFISLSSERHHTTKRLQNYKEDQPSQPINYVDNIINNSIAQQKQSFLKSMQDIQDKISLGVKKTLGHLDTFGKSKSNVMKLDKKKGSTLDVLSTEYLELIIDLYWNKHKDYDSYDDIPEWVEEQIFKCSNNVQQLLTDVFAMINDEANKCLSKIKSLTKESRIEEIKKQMDENKDRDNSPPRFPKPKKSATVEKRPISSRVFSKTANLQDIDQKINEQQDLIKKDLEKLQDNKTNLYSENSNLQELNERSFQILSERIQAKKSEIERMEKSKNIQNLKIARNQLNSLIREQVQTYKCFNAQQVRVDTRILEVLKNLEYKAEELHESKMIAQKVAIQKALFKNQTTNNNNNSSQDLYQQKDEYELEQEIFIDQDATSEFIDDSSPIKKNNYIYQPRNSKPHSYSINNLNGSNSSHVRISTRKPSQVRNQSATKERPQSPAPNQFMNKTSFYSQTGASFQIDSLKVSSCSSTTQEKKSTNNNNNWQGNNNWQTSSNWQNNNFSSPQKQQVGGNGQNAYLNNNCYHISGGIKKSSVFSSNSPIKSKRASTMMTSSQETTATFSPIKIVKQYS